MDLSEIWQTLPRELIDKILNHHVDAFSNADPTYAWTVLRQLSHHQKRRIERFFASFWLPKMTLTVYRDSSTFNEYVFERVIPRDVSLEEEGTAITDEMVQFRTSDDGEKSYGIGRYHPATNRNVTVRLGEGVLFGGCIGGYILNDTGLPGLKILDNGKTIQFSWKGAMNELLREEMFMRILGDKLFTNSCQAWGFCHPPWGDSSTPFNNNEPERAISWKEKVRIWKYEVQMQRRVGALKHRARKSITFGPCEITAHFRATSENWHRQKPIQTHSEEEEEEEDESRVACCSHCSRHDGPDIFEVASQEESIVPQLEIFQMWASQEERGSDPDSNDKPIVFDGTIAELYAEEFGWACCIACYMPEDSVDSWQAKRARDSLRRFVRSKFKTEKDGAMRWDSLG